MLSYRSGNTRRRYWLFLLAWIVAIFVFSTDSFSSNESSRFVIPILTFFFPGLSGPEIWFLHGAVRKSAHVAEYLVLGFFAYRAFSAGRQASLKPRLAAAALVVTVALSDEFHQSLTLSRTGSLFDVGYDCLGGFAALLLLPSSKHEVRTVHSHSVL